MLPQAGNERRWKDLRLKKGDIVNRWHDTGAFGYQMVFGEVIRVNRKTVTVRWERNRIWRIEPHHIDLITGKFAEEIRAEYLSLPTTRAPDAATA